MIEEQLEIKLFKVSQLQILVVIKNAGVWLSRYSHPSRLQVDEHCLHGTLDVRNMLLDHHYNSRYHQSLGLVKMMCLGQCIGGPHSRRMK